MVSGDDAEADARCLRAELMHHALERMRVAVRLRQRRLDKGIERGAIGHLDATESVAIAARERLQQDSRELILHVDLSRFVVRVGGHVADDRQRCGVSADITG